jgi:hypothetical protein
MIPMERRVALFRGEILRLLEEPEAPVQQHPLAVFLRRLVGVEDRGDAD